MTARSTAAAKAVRALGGELIPLLPGAALVTGRLSGRGPAYRTVPLGPRSALVTPARPSLKDHAATEYAANDWLLREHLRFVLGTYAVNCVLDVGANIGQYGRLLRDIGYRGHIVSFEPVPRFFRELRLATQGDRRWRAHRMALGRENGELEMNIVPGTLSSALPASDLGRQRFARLAKPPKTKQVPVRRLADVLDDVLPQGLRQPRILLKLDTQGFDLEAFAGLGDRLDDIVALQSEVVMLAIYEGMPSITESLDTYRGAGFDITALYPVSRDTATFRALEYDCVMVRADKLPAQPGV
jgi:FkbM family methyltransferase